MFILSRIKFCLNQEQVIDHTTRQSLFMLLFISHVSHCSYYTSVTVHATRLSLFMPHVCLCSYDTSVTIHVTRQSLFVSPASHCSDHKLVTVHVTLHSLFRSDVSHCSYHSLVTVHITRQSHFISHVLLKQHWDDMKMNDPRGQQSGRKMFSQLARYAQLTSGLLPV